MAAITTMFAFFMAAITPIAKQLLVGLGFGFMTYTGVSVAFNSLVSSMTTSISMIPPDILVYAQMSGVFEALGLILSAISFKLSFMTFSRLQKTA